MSLSKLLEKFQDFYLMDVKDISLSIQCTLHMS